MQVEFNLETVSKIISIIAGAVAFIPAFLGCVRLALTPKIYFALQKYEEHQRRNVGYFLIILCALFVLCLSISYGFSGLFGLFPTIIISILLIVSIIMLVIVVVMFLFHKKWMNSDAWFGRWALILMLDSLLISTTLTSMLPKQGSKIIVVSLCFSLMAAYLFFVVLFVFSNDNVKPVAVINNENGDSWYVFGMAYDDRILCGNMDDMYAKDMEYKLLPMEKLDEYVLKNYPTGKVDKE